MLTAHRPPPAPRRLSRFIPTGGWPLLVLAMLFLLPGTLSHAPWKIDDATHFGAVWRAAQQGDWLLFFAAGTTPEPPLFYWTGRLFGALLTPLLDWPDAVRLAGTFYAALGLGALYLTARRQYGPDLAGAAPLALIGSLGFLVQSHETQPMLAALAGFAALFAGLAVSQATTPSNGRQGSLLIGAGLAGIVLSEGLALLPAAIAILAAPWLVRGEANARPRLRTVLGGLLVALALTLPWFLALAAQAPQALDAFLGSELARLARPTDPLRNAGRYLAILPWYAWPALPLAAAGLWQQRAAWRSAAIWPTLVALAALWINLSFVFEARQAPALLLLVPFALLATTGVAILRRGATSAFDWFSRLTFSLIVLLAWLGCAAIHLGWPPKLSHNFLRLSPGFEPGMNPALLAAALIVTALWFRIVFSTSRSALRSLAHWSSGLTAMWVLIVLLWLPWIEHIKSYTSVARDLQAALPAGTATCVAGQDLGAAQRAALEYALARPLPPLAAAGEECRYLLVQGTRGEVSPGDAWRKIWEGRRPNDRVERLRLYHRG